METSMMFGLMDLIVFGCGLYIIYAYYLLVAKNEIKQGILVSQKTDVKRCKDLEGYKKYMGIRLLAFGLAAVLSGAVGLYQDYVAPVPAVVYYVSLILFFAVMIWYLMSVKKAEKTFW